jgi:hypothetical protein
MLFPSFLEVSMEILEIHLFRGSPRSCRAAVCVSRSARWFGVITGRALMRLAQGSST